MKSLKESKLTNQQLNHLIKTFPAVEIELKWGYTDEGNDEGLYQKKDHLIECEEFNIETDLFIKEEGETTPATHLQRSEYNRNSLDIQVGTIKLIPDDGLDININADQYEVIKNKIITEIKVL